MTAQSADVTKKPQGAVAFEHVAFRDVEVPESTEKVTSNGWVEWGADNLYPQFLWYLYYCSPIHQGVVNSKVDYIASGGLKFEGSTEEWNTVFSNGRSEYNLDEVAEMVTWDNEVANGYFLHGIKDPLTGSWYIESMDFELIRPSVTGNVFYYSENWSTKQQSFEKTGFRSIPDIHHMNDEDTECLMYVKTKSRQRKAQDPKAKVKVHGGFFSVPSYSGGIESIMTDIEINFFRYAEVVNGYKGGTILYLNNGDPENDTERRKILRDLKLEVTDRKKWGGMGVIFGEGPDGEPKVVTMTGNDLHQRYESTEVGLKDKMMIAHSVTNPKLFGVMATNAMSETNDQASYDRFQKNYCNKRRKNIATSFNYMLKKLNGMQGKIDFNVPTLEVEKQLDEQSQFANRLNGMSPLVANAGLAVLTLNEKRKFIWGLPALPGGDAVPLAPAAAAMRAMKGEDPAVVGFSAVGRPRTGMKILNRREVTDFEVDNDQEFVDEFFSKKFAAALSDLQLNILRLISEGKTSKEIQDELKLDAKQLSKELKVTDKLGYTEGLGLTDKGQIEIVNIEQVEVVYSYEERPDAPELIGTSRPFCVQMLKLDRVYTRDEINSISTAIGRSVWLYRGGWYHDPETDKNQPSCRHYWLQNLVIQN